MTLFTSSYMQPRLIDPILIPYISCCKKIIEKSPKIPHRFPYHTFNSRS